MEKVWGKTTMTMMRAGRETVLYYSPAGNKNAGKLKGVLVRMGVRIRNVSEEQFEDSIGAILGLKGFETEAGKKELEKTTEHTSREDGQGAGESVPGTDAGARTIDQEVLIMHNFSGSRLDELLLGMRRAKVEKINLKAVVTESNVGWSFYHLYEEISAEHERMHQNTNQ